eukprot:TRINITY_DN38005_c0_g1_i1.p1 TRINITY_DN38005_c0_g1~~TRINITY_DN38005_c0_g1_i1.p1  ORF type:complete len:746 (-),score=178.12 TRINITY_DN38005_c0_g1_i1:176-2413(-)
MDVDYELSQQLEGHGSQVRCVIAVGDSTIVTGGLDAQVIMWRRASPKEGFTLLKKLTHHSETVYALATSHDTPGGFYSGSKDKTAVRLDADGNPILQFKGHEGNVCSVVEMGAQVVTGAWDGKAKVWDGKTGECRHTLDAGAHAVTVAVLPTGEIVTGSQDCSLRVFRGTEMKHKVDAAHGDIIRSIAVSSSHLLTSSNDNLIKMWSFDGCEMAKLQGHQSFVYGATHSSDGQTILSSSDDCTLKLWNVSDCSCKQSIMHAGTVWNSLGLSNGDVVTCCADSIVRVWTNDPERMAPEAERQTQAEMAKDAAMQAAAKGSSSSSVQSVDISEMPNHIGKKNGEIKCFKEGSTVFAYSWNQGARCWDKIGEVVGQDEPKKQYEGDRIFPAGEYDFVWDVDMGAAYGMKKLPYNKGQNPMEIAEAFCAREEINKSNIDQIRQFIVQNSGEGGAPPAPAPPAGGYTAPAASEPVSTLFPVLTPLSFKDGKLEALQKKLLEFNDGMPEGSKMDENDVMHLNTAIDKLKSGVMSKELRPIEKEIIHQKLGDWPQDKLFPVIDLWRLYLVLPQSADNFKGTDRGTSYILKINQLLSADVNSALALCCSRYLANLFIYQTNRYAVFDKRELVLKTIEPALKSTNKHTKVALTSVLLNLAIVHHESSAPPKVWDKAGAATIARLAMGFLSSATPDDGDAQQRAVLAIGSLLPRDKANGSTIAQQVKDAGLLTKLLDLESKVGSNYTAELRRLLS